MQIRIPVNRIEEMKSKYRSCFIHVMCFGYFLIFSFNFYSLELLIQKLVNYSTYCDKVIKNYCHFYFNFSEFIINI